MDRDAVRLWVNRAGDLVDSRLEHGEDATALSRAYGAYLEGLAGRIPDDCVQLMVEQAQAWHSLLVGVVQISVEDSGRTHAQITGAMRMAALIELDGPPPLRIVRDE